MKSAMVVLGLVVLAAGSVGMAAAADVNEVKVKVSGLNWPTSWGKAVINGLKRLSGAKEVAQDDFQKGVGTYVVSFDANPKVKMADVKKSVGNYKLESVGLKLTTTVGDGYTVGDIKLANPKEEDLLKEVAALKGKKAVLSGTLTEDDKGAQTLTLSRVAEAK